MSTLKRYWKAIAAALGSLIGLLLLRDFFQKDLKAKLNNADTDKQDALLDQQKNELEKQADSLDKENEALRDKMDDKAKKLSPDEVQDYWNKK